MNTLDAKRILCEKEPQQLYEAVEPALKDGELRDFLVEHAFDKNETIRYNCVRVLGQAASCEPRLFYVYWDRFAEMIESPNGFHRSAAAQLIASLSAADQSRRLDGLLTRYLRLRDDPRVMVTHYFIVTLDRVCQARPDLQKKVITSLLNISKGSHTQQHQELLRADILGVLDRAFDALSPDLRKKALAFAQESTATRSPRGRKAAKLFLSAHSA